MYTTVTFLSHVIDIDWSNDGIRLGDPGPMMGIDRVLTAPSPDWGGVGPESV